jgi:MFS transporter, DHA1 family, multidrug resistance protein
MSSSNIAPTQPVSAESVPDAPREIAPPEAADERHATSLGALQTLLLGGLSALGPLSTDMYLPALPALSYVGMGSRFTVTLPSETLDRRPS